LGESGNVRWCVLWVVAALVSLYPVAAHLGAGFPFFTAIWLVVPLIAVLRWRNPALVGFRAIPPRLYWVTATTNLGLLLLVIVLFEPWSHAYGTLVREAIRGDATFAWLSHYNSPTGWLLMFLFSGLVTIFAEELFFRGWLLQLLLRRRSRWFAIFLQGLLFALLQALPALFLSPVQAVVWVGVYSFLGVGLINGWAASRTQSIWPGLIAATLMNLIVTMVM
jgi:membrane protease YdiL (CAAX protease family)